MTARQPFAVTGLLWQGATVTGITGQVPGGNAETIHADCVIGADGRFSTIAHQVSAQSLDVHNEAPTTVYYAGWKNIKPLDATF